MFADDVASCALTDSWFGAGEAVVLGHQVSVVPLTGYHLQHVAHLLPALRAPPVHPEPDVRPVTRKLPPGPRSGKRIGL